MTNRRTLKPSEKNQASALLRQEDGMPQGRSLPWLLHATDEKNRRLSWLLRYLHMLKPSPAFYHRHTETQWKNALRFLFLIIQSALILIQSAFVFNKNLSSLILVGGNSPAAGPRRLVHRPFSAKNRQGRYRKQGNCIWKFSAYGRGTERQRSRREKQKMTDLRLDWALFPIFSVSSLSPFGEALRYLRASVVRLKFKCDCPGIAKKSFAARPIFR